MIPFLHSSNIGQHTINSSDIHDHLLKVANKHNTIVKLMQPDMIAFSSWLSLNNISNTHPVEHGWNILINNRDHLNVQIHSYLSHKIDTNTQHTVHPDMLDICFNRLADFSSYMLKDLYQLESRVISQYLQELKVTKQENLNSFIDRANTIKRRNNLRQKAIDSGLPILQF